MTHRERFFTTINHQIPDRIPFDLEGTGLTASHQEFLKNFVQYLGIKANSQEEALEKILQKYDIDFRRVGALFEPKSALSDYSRSNEGYYTDCWGIERKWTGLYWDISKYPLMDASLDEIKKFPWPDAANIDKKLINAITEKAKRLYNDTDYVVVAEHPVLGYLELGCWMFGFDDFLYRLLGEPETATWFFERYHQYVEDVCELYYGSVGEYIHITTSGDDFGTQTGPFISPELFSEMIAPWYKKRIAITKNICNAKYFHHTCGSVYRLIDSIIDMGVDILNPIQPGVFEMEPERLKDYCGDRLVFWGGIDEQKLLSNATPQVVKQEVIRITNILNKNGGYIMAASHNIQPDVPPQNIDAMFSAFD